MQAYWVGVDPPGRGPSTSGGRRQRPSQVHGGRPAARWGQSAAVVQAAVQLETMTLADWSQAAGAMQPFALESQGSATRAQTYWAGVPTGWQA